MAVPADRPTNRDIRAYLAYIKDQQGKGLPRGPAARLVRRVSSPGLRDAAKLYGTTLLAPITSRRARAIAAGRTDLLLHLGSGANRLPGWVNIDLLGMGSDLAWDLRRRLPFPDACAQAAWLEHVIQEFTLADALALLEECHRVLRPGGTIRVGVPDLGRYIRSYTGDRELIEQVRPNRPTSLLAVAEVTQFHGNRSAYDAETLVMLLEGAGFFDVESRGFRESKTLEPVPDLEERRLETLYALYASRTCLEVGFPPADQGSAGSPQRMEGGGCSGSCPPPTGMPTWVRDDLRAYVVEQLGDPGAVLVVVESWTDDPARCRAVRIPEQVGFRTKPELARIMLERALDAGVPASWVTADEVSGGSPALREWLEERQVPYVQAV